MDIPGPVEALAASIPWVNDVPAGLVMFIGVSELLGGIGLLLPSILRVKPVLTPLAAAGLALVMLFAAVFHLLRGEAGTIGLNIVVMLIAILVAWGRSKKVPITPKAS